MRIQSMDITLSSRKKKTLVSFFHLHSLFQNALLELLMCFLSTVVLHILTVTHLDLSSGYTAAAGGGVPRSRVLDGSFKKGEEKMVLIPFAR